MTQQPEALRLADLLETDGWPDAAAELRRLHDTVAWMGKTLSKYEELRRVIDGGSESMTHKDAVNEVRRMANRITTLEAALTQAVEALEQIACYRPLTFAECLDAEAVMGIAENGVTAAKQALGERQ